MKITVCFLLVALGCFFTPTASNCIRKCVKSCESRSSPDLSCLRMALASNFPATVNALAQFLCSYDRCKNMKNKDELLKALKNLLDVTGCPLGNLLGAGTTVEDLLMDVDGTLEHLLRTVVQLLHALNLGSLYTPLCGLLGPLLTKVSRILLLIGGQNLGRVTHATRNILGGTGGLIRRKQIAGTLPVKTPGLLRGVSEAVGSLTGGTEAGIGDLLRRVTEGVGGLVNGLTGVDGITGGLRGVTGIVDGITGGKSGSGGLVGGLTGGLTGLDGITEGIGGVTGILNGLTGGKGGSGGILGGLTGGLGKNTQGLGGLTEGLGGLTGVLGGLPLGDNAGTNRGITSTGNKDLYPIEGDLDIGVNTGVTGEITGRGTLGLSSGQTDSFVGNGGLPHESAIFSSDPSTDLNSGRRLPTNGVLEIANGVTRLLGSSNGFLGI